MSEHQHSQSHVLEPIGFIESPYTEKFAVPRQPGLVPAATARIVLHGDYANPDCVRGLTEFSHIWVLFLFHQTTAQGWKPLVRPPRLGGNEKRGVFATRSTFRPNNLGMSVVKVIGITYRDKQTIIEVQSADWVNHTPVIDIKPYVPYADAIPEAVGGFAPSAPEQSLATTFSADAQQQLQQLNQQYPELQALISQVLAQDPRPAYQQNDTAEREYGMTLYDVNIRWQVKNQQNHVISISKGF
ncbi:tRNA (N6-threonylcarbamoyladenosine(37)-N6)-methyltransferase TrmO [Pseudidiomarina tainanensis]|jgi:probable methyltransferase, YaeB/AF_0241 family|uniref:tRNA (N6-threonylcarbamoyladenosine(37)-N6)-methyltransferase TrmO n=1 Tax=Pseudidiomarina tainanensis TaxID=502365 RepID=A0ACD2HLC5_9GAMM|nr:tRNA (N6-threonylcarbamoyladenosine(37)-N6)-methyltransferase TrmO [Pseudidiomarina tainanensis]RZQ56640.1 tRNA (N6-threonylcarbamoyladenosine(37)-N6)-methyltransferase TrmO [Pseudidiomarina tainanensis]